MTPDADPGHHPAGSPPPPPPAACHGAALLPRLESDLRTPRRVAIAVSLAPLLSVVLLVLVAPGFFAPCSKRG